MVSNDARRSMMSLCSEASSRLVHANGPPLSACENRQVIGEPFTLGSLANFGFFSDDGWAAIAGRFSRLPML